MSGTIRDRLRQRLAGAAAEQMVDELFAFMAEHGQTFYDEIVTQIEHALQCAELAQQRDFGDEAVTAALLHDIGHLLVGEFEAQQGPPKQDFIHEEVGADFLTDYFPEQVTEPIRLHVAAKRYLCSTDPEYYDQLSDGSKRSLEVQGGRLSPDEQTELEGNPFLNVALEIRRLDDLGKLSDHNAPPIETYRDTVAKCLRSNSRGSVNSDYTARG